MKILLGNGMEMEMEMEMKKKMKMREEFTEFTYFIPIYPKSTKNLLFWMVLRETFVFISRSDMDLTYKLVMNLHPSR